MSAAVWPCTGCGRNIMREPCAYCGYPDLPDEPPEFDQAAEDRREYWAWIGEIVDKEER